MVENSNKKNYLLLHTMKSAEKYLENEPKRI